MFGASEMLKRFKALKVWQKSYDLCLKVYRMSAALPKDERCDLTSQIRRSAVPIPSNIAEGYGLERKPRLPGTLFHVERAMII